MYIHDERVFPDEEITPGLDYAPDKEATVIETEDHVVHYPSKQVAREVVQYCENLGITLDYYLYEFDIDSHPVPDEDDL